jgi:hypothetical protein
MEEIRADISEIMMLIFPEISPNSSFVIRSMPCVKSPFAKEAKHMLILVIGATIAFLNQKTRTVEQLPAITPTMDILTIENSL